MVLVLRLLAVLSIGARAEYRRGAGRDQGTAPIIDNHSASRGGPSLALQLVAKSPQLDYNNSKHIYIPKKFY